VVGQPVGTPGRQETIDSVNLLLDALRAYYVVDTFAYHRHSEFMSTSCGDDIHFEDYPQGIVIDPCEGCECPECPECPEVPDGSRVVTVEQLTRWRNESSWLIGDEIDEVIQEESERR
jgi:hypothetical protein